MKEEIREIAGDVIVGFTRAPSSSWGESAIVLGAPGDGLLEGLSRKIALYLATKGYLTEVVDRYAEDVDIDIKRLAVSASLGSIGKNGLVVTPEFGSRAIFSVVLLDAQIEPDEKREFDFCEGCSKCIEACPCGAISESAFDASTCEEYNENKRCVLCAEVCPVGKGK